MVEIENPKTHKAFCEVMGKKWGEGYSKWHKDYEKRMKNYEGKLTKSRMLSKGLRKVRLLMISS